ncbi:muscarinic acetylcholine receptor M2-like [Scyliorhinus canicula]|uniref:muscarinic acetylcholine receptor M2-like n=1 Tax=Scyliorhinus canicula TaxID=7830 RepID=UPI0018F33FF4|nr:muscarinic acetylcholine receptor M2-like [Scyliorhinus canicula]
MRNSTEANESLSYLTGWIDTGGSLYKAFEVGFIVIVTGSLSLVTIIGNILVMASIRVNRQLQTINNYFIFSLACADLVIGAFSMNLYTIYTVTGYWPMGTVVCDLWLAVDYVASSASGMNLLIISFDRYFCVTKPFSYPVRRTPTFAGMMIAAAWVLSFILWVPAILFWQFIVGERTVGEDECYVQFLSNPAVIFVTAIAAFYLPVIIMVILYVQISRASRSRVKDDTNVAELSKCGINGRLVKSKIMKHNKNHIANVPNGLGEVKMENNKITGEMPINNCGQATDKELSNASTSRNVVQLNQNDKGMIQENRSACNAQRFSGMNNSVLIRNIESKCQKTEDCDPTAKVASDINGKNDNGIEKRAANEGIQITRTPAKKKKKGAASREEKVTRTILAILLAFIITWSPYFATVLISTVCSTCVPHTVWTIGYWVVYINSTVNPACYALCNPTFKKTFKHLLLCQYKNIRTAR